MKLKSAMLFDCEPVLKPRFRTELEWLPLALNCKGSIAVPPLLEYESLIVSTSEVSALILLGKLFVNGITSSSVTFSSVSVRSCLRGPVFKNLADFPLPKVRMWAAPSSPSLGESGCFADVGLLLDAEA